VAARQLDHEAGDDRDDDRGAGDRRRGDVDLTEALVSPSRRRPRIVSLRPPSRNTAPKAAMTPSDPTPAPG
jgi:hypothetical protein